MLNKIFKKLSLKYNNEILEKLDVMSMAQAAMLIKENNKKKDITSISDVEFKVYSQWGEDGIIQYLINNIDIKNKYFIEFGVENYTESNTRFLLKNNNWSGLIIDGDKKNIEYVKKDKIYWRHDLIALNAFITKDNINQIFMKHGIEGNIGLLSIDIDGNDYWIWKCIEVIEPLIVICEYNSIFGKDYAVTVPYKDNFIRTREHFSNLYFGASIKALCLLAKEKGYKFIGSTSAGNDAFFVRNDVSAPFKEVTVEEGYTVSKFRESRDIKGNLTYVSGVERLNLISEMSLYNIEDDIIYLISELYKL